MGCFDYFGTPFQKTVPLVYDESVSMAQQVAAIMGKLCELAQNQLSKEELEALRQWFIQDQAVQTDQLQRYADSKFNDIQQWLYDQMCAYPVWDVTQGGLNRNRETMRNLFNDLTLHACTVDELAEWGSVDQLADSCLNVRGLAVYSWYLFGSTYVPNGVWQEGCKPEPPDPGPTPGAVTVQVLADMRKLNGYFVTPDMSDEPATVVDIAHASIVDGFWTDGTVGAGAQATVDMLSGSVMEDNKMKVGD